MTAAALDLDGFIARNTPPRTAGSIWNAPALLRQRLVDVTVEAVALTDRLPVISFDVADALNELLNGSLAPNDNRIYTTLRIVAETHADDLFRVLDELRAAEDRAQGYDDDAGCLDDCEWFRLQHGAGSAHCPGCEQRVIEMVDERVDDLLRFMEWAAPRATRELIVWFSA